MKIFLCIFSLFSLTTCDTFEQKLERFEKLKEVCQHDYANKRPAIKTIVFECVPRKNCSKRSNSEQWYMKYDFKYRLYHFEGAMGNGTIPELEEEMAKFTETSNAVNVYYKDEAECLAEAHCLFDFFNSKPSLEEKGYKIVTNTIKVTEKNENGEMVEV